MKGTTHLIIGALIGVHLVQPDQPLTMLATGTICAVAALLPDVDHPKSILRRRSGILGHALFSRLTHRGFTHSVTALVLVALASLLIDARFAPAIAAGYASHLCADMLTKHGIALFAPFAPRRMGLGLISTGGLAEQGIAMLAFIVLLLTLFPFDPLRTLDFIGQIMDHGDCVLCI